MRDRLGDAGDAEEVLLRLLDTLGDRGGNLAGLAVTDTDEAVAIADDHEGGEAEATTTLHDLRHAVDGHDALQELALLRVAAVATVAVRVALAAATAGLAGLVGEVGRGGVNCRLGCDGLGGLNSHVLLLVSSCVAHRSRPPSRAPSAIAATRPA